MERRSRRDVLRANSAPLQTAPPPTAPPADQPLAQAEEVQQPAADQITPAAAEPAPAKPTRIVADAACGDCRSSRAGRHHGERDRPDRPHAGAPRHAPQAARDVGCRKDRKDDAAFVAADVPRRGCGAAARRVACTTRVPRTDTRRKSGRAFHRSARARRKSGARAAAERVTPAPGTVHVHPRNDRAHPRTASSEVDGNAGPARPQRADVIETEAAAISPAGAAACERTRSTRCGARA